MMTVYRAGIIGCGKIASDFADDPKMQGDIFTHAEAYSHCDKTLLAAVCDLDPVRLEKCGERWGVHSRYEDLSTMILHENLDIISVCTPDHTHPQVIQQILDTPGTIKAILCEKPLANSLKEAQQIAALANQKQVILAVMYMRRFANNFQTLKNFLSTGKLGEIQAVSGWYTKGVRHNGTHWFDSLRYLIGEVTWVMAWDRLGDGSDDPTLDLVIGLDQGCLASLRACDSKAYTIFEMEILGTLGRVRILDSGFQMEYSKVMDSRRYTGYKELEVSPYPFGDRKNLTLKAVENLVGALETGEPVACSAEDGIEAIRIAEAAVQSVNCGEVIHLD